MCSLAVTVSMVPVSHSVTKVMAAALWALTSSASSFVTRSSVVGGSGSGGGGVYAPPMAAPS